MPKSIGTIKDVKLRIYRCSARYREQRANSVNEFSMELEGVRRMTIIDRVVHISANRGHGQSTIVVANVISKCAVRSSWCGEVLIENIGDMLKRWEGDVTLITAHAKLGINVGGVRKSFNSPVQSMAKGTLNVHLPKAVNHPGRTERLARKRKSLRLNMKNDMIWQRRLYNDLIEHLKRGKKGKLTGISSGGGEGEGAEGAGAGAGIGMGAGAGAGAGAEGKTEV